MVTHHLGDHRLAISEEPSESLENEKGERFDTQTRDDVARTKGTSLEARQLAAEQTVQDIKSSNPVVQTQ